MFPFLFIFRAVVINGYRMSIESFVEVHPVQVSDNLCTVSSKR